MIEFLKVGDKVRVRHVLKQYDLVYTIIKIYTSKKFNGPIVRIEYGSSYMDCFPEDLIPVDLTPQPNNTEWKEIWDQNL